MQDTNLVRYIMKHDGIAPAELAVHLGVKERAMRDRIRHANDSMHDRGIIVYDRARQRYVVDILDSEGFEAWLSGSAARDAFDRLPSTPEERVAYLLQDLLSRMHALYQGEFLPAFTSIEWVLYENIYYRNLYIDCTLNMCSYLYKKKQFDDIITLCDQSCLMYQEEERFHRYKLMAYLGLGLPSAALDYYRSTVNFFSQKFGIDINHTLNDIYQEILSRLPSTRMDINSLEEDLKEEQDSNHTFYCNFDIFKNFYQLNRRSVRRSHSKHYLLLLTLDSNDGYPCDVETTKEEMQILYRLLSTQLRKNDIFTRSSHSQYSVILTVPNEYGSEVAERRILQKYDQVKQHDNIILTVERKLIE